MSLGIDLLSKVSETANETKPEMSNSDLSFDPDRRLGVEDGMDFDGISGNIDLNTEAFDPDKRIDVNNDGRADAIQDAPFHPDNRNRENVISETQPNGEIKDDKEDLAVQGINQRLGSPESIRELINDLPNAIDRIDILRDAIDTINDPTSSPLEIRQATTRIGQLKGDMLEQATKESLSDLGFDVQDKVEMVQGETGNTIPDIVATNNTDNMISALGRDVQPGETLSAECKCGNSNYIGNQLKEHIPNQLSGQSGYRTLITTSDINDVRSNLAQEVCQKYEAVQVTISLSAADITSALKEAIV